jgi:hypothetical protein
MFCIRNTEGTGGKNKYEIGLLINEEMREYLVIYEEAVSHI